MSEGLQNLAPRAYEDVPQSEEGSARRRWYVRMPVATTILVVAGVVVFQLGMKQPEITKIGEQDSLKDGLIQEAYKNLGTYKNLGAGFCRVGKKIGYHGRPAKGPSFDEGKCKAACDEIATCSAFNFSPKKKKVDRCILFFSSKDKSWATNKWGWLGLSDSMVPALPSSIIAYKGSAHGKDFGDCQVKDITPVQELKISDGRIFGGPSWASVSHKNDVFFQEMVKPLISHQQKFEAQGPAKDYMKDEKGQKFFTLFRSARVDPPGLTHFQQFFEKDANGQLSFKKDSKGKQWNLLRIQAQSMKWLRDETLKLQSWNMAGKNVVITGMSSGIGFSLAVRLAELGANVYGCARTRNFFDYGREVALTDGVEQLREDRRYSGTAQEVASALGTTASKVIQSTFLKLDEKNGKGEQLYKMPQDHHPIYTGPFDVADSTFKNIHFDEVDVRSHAHVDKYVKKLRDTYAVKQIDYLLINAQTETSFIPVHGHQNVLDDIRKQSPLSTEELIKEYPDRTAGEIPSAQGIIREYQVGCKYLIAKLAHAYGHDTFAQNTDIILVSSIAGALGSYHAFGSYSSYFGEYVNVKAEMAAWAKQMRTSAGQPLRINVVYPGVFMTNVNFQWVCDAVNLGGKNSCQHPRKVVKADWQSGSPAKNGKFFAPYTTTGAQAFMDAVWKTTTPSMAPGAEYASLQIMAMMRKNKALSGEHRMDVLVEGSPAQGSAGLFQEYFGAAGGEVAKHSIYQDFSKESSNPTYQFQVLGLPNGVITEKTTRAARSWLLHAGKKKGR